MTWLAPEGAGERLHEVASGGGYTMEAEVEAESRAGQSCTGLALDVQGTCVGACADQGEVG